MNSIRKQPTFRFPLPVIAFADWLLVLPAAALLAAAALRLLQWADAYLHTPTAAALLFLALPAFGLAIGFAALLHAWRNDAGHSVS